MAIRDLVLVGLGGAAGACLRYLISLWALARWGEAFPFGTLVINLSGCFAIGLISTLALDRVAFVEPQWRLLLVTGLLGGYTTFSAFGLESLRLLQTGAVPAAVAYAVGSTGLGILAVWAGMATVRLLA